MEEAESRAWLPREFTDRMRELLGEEYEAFAESYEKPRVQGLRLNLLKGDKERMAEENRERFCLRPVPWCQEGYYYQEDRRPGRHPYHEAGMYYIQEPSAMAAVSLLDPRPGERVLDLCGAPGGKSTHIGSRLKGQGLLVCNEIHSARAKILSRNVERMGIKNAVVLNEDSGRLAEVFPEFFHKIVVDAPCSGEGMFRKDEKARQEWSLENVRMCRARQREILENAAAMLQPGGRLIYSTCTFSPEEDEAQIGEFLEAHPEFSVAKGTKPAESLGMSPGREEWSTKKGHRLYDTYRIWPHLSEGEGHYLALLEKAGKREPSGIGGEGDTGTGAEASGIRKPESRKRAGKREQSGRQKKGQGILPSEEAARKSFQEFFRELSDTPMESVESGRIILFGDQIYCLPESVPDLKGLRVLRPGLHLGTWKGNYFEPAHALALFLKAEQVKPVVRLDPDGEEVLRYLTGETLLTDMGGKGWVLVCAGDYSLGWGKLADGRIKNHYPRGLRIRR